MNHFELLTPGSLPEAFQMMETRKDKELKIIAGGTDLIPPMRVDKLAVDSLLDISALGLNKLSQSEDGVSIGATCTMKQIAGSEALRDHFPALCKAARSVGAVQTRGLATIGGNICSAVPSLDGMPPLLVHDARFLLVSLSGRRWVEAADFITGPRSTQLKRGELLAEIFLPHPHPDFRADFFKFGRRKALSLSIVNAAFGCRLESHVISGARVVIGACAPTPVRAVGAENYLNGKTAEQIDLAELNRLVQSSISPISDIRASAEYRSDLAAALIRKLIRSVVKGEEL